jgi:hypothetical protein
MAIWDIIIWLILIGLFFLPTIIALKRNHSNKLFLILLNWVGYWTWGITWLIALGWAIGETQIEDSDQEPLKPTTNSDKAPSIINRPNRPIASTPREEKPAIDTPLEVRESIDEASAEKQEMIDVQFLNHEERIKRINHLLKEKLITDEQASRKIDKILREI